jgi:hypothetical protein
MPQSIFARNQKLHVMLHLNNPNFDNSNLIKSIESRMNKLGVPVPEKNNSHFTIWEAVFNYDHPDCQHVLNEASKTMRNYVNETFKKVGGLTVNSTKGNYQILGDDKLFFSKMYSTNDNDNVSKVRMAVYDYIKNICGNFSKRSPQTFNNKKYYIYEYKNLPLMAVPEHCHGKGTWDAHLTLSSLENIKAPLHNQFNKYGIQILINQLSGSIGNIDSIDLKKTNLKISVSPIY